MKGVTMIGLGRMGKNMARRLLRHGMEVTVHNRTPAKIDQLVEEGARGLHRLEDIERAFARDSRLEKIRRPGDTPGLLGNLCPHPLLSAARL